MPVTSPDRCIPSCCGPRCVEESLDISRPPIILGVEVGAVPDHENKRSRETPKHQNTSWTLDVPAPKNAKRVRHAFSLDFTGNVHNTWRCIPPSLWTWFATSPQLDALMTHCWDGTIRPTVVAPRNSHTSERLKDHHALPKKCGYS